MSGEFVILFFTRNSSLFQTCHIRYYGRIGIDNVVI